MEIYEKTLHIKHWEKSMLYDSYLEIKFICYKSTQILLCVYMAHVENLTCSFAIIVSPGQN